MRKPWWGLALLVVALATIAVGATLVRDLGDGAGLRESRVVRLITTGNLRAIIAGPGIRDDQRSASADGIGTVPDEADAPAVDAPGTSDDFCPT